MKDDHINIFNDSFQICASDPLFLDRFYKVFFSSSEEIKEKFKHTDMKKQKKVLLKSLAYMMNARSNPGLISATAVNHDKKHLNISPHLYGIWLNSMVEAVKQSDTRFNQQIEDAWRKTMQPGIDLMIKKYLES